MDLQHLSIGQMAKLNHISEQTLRLYDKMNLLKPISVNQEIHERLNAMNLNTMPAILQSRYDYIKKEMEKMKINQAAILRSINSFNRYMTLPQIEKYFMNIYRNEKSASTTQGQTTSPIPTTNTNIICACLRTI